MNQQIQVHFHPLKVQYCFMCGLYLYVYIYMCGSYVIMSYIHTYNNFSMVHIITYVEDVSGLRGWRLWLAAKQILTICMYQFNCSPLVTCTNQIVCLRSHTHTHTDQIAHFSHMHQ